MELGEALDRIDAIRAHVARTGVFRGYKAATVGSTGLLALLAAAVQPIVAPDPLGNVGRYLVLWIGVAAVSFAAIAAELAWRCLKSASMLEREKSLKAVQCLLPSLAAGAAVTWAIVQFSPEAAQLLPGLWAVMFSLGVAASCGQLPSPAAAVAVYYFAAGVTCLAIARDESALSPWAMAGTFGVGQLLTAAILYLTLERRHAES